MAKVPVLLTLLRAACFGSGDFPENEVIHQLKKLRSFKFLVSEYEVL